MTDTALGLVVVVIGLLAVIGSALNWRIVTHSGKLLNLLFGDMIARTIYIVIGVFLMAMGIARMFGIYWFE
jgi:uncharacterized membrane protein YuzA (DUF378 family)